ncbi:MAG: LysR family transcriptional regulator [Rhodospirillales bacterium]|nr:LysR family transcriptional regulator [Rhodospirillales bacterium]
MALLENIRVFVRVVELGSLSAAGRQLRLSAAVVSHRMKTLEAQLGVRLLNRTTRQVQPTEEGLAYYNACQDVIGALDYAESVVADVGGIPRGTLRITAPLLVGRRVLGPLVPEFQDAYPKIDVQLRLSDHLLDLLSEAVDVAVRMAIMQDSSLITRKIMDCERVLCAAPSYIDAHGAPRSPDDLLSHDCLLLRFPGSQQFRWTLQSKDGPAVVPVRGRFDADDGDVLTTWALTGRGIALKPLWEVADHLRAGRLKPVLLDHAPEPVMLSVLYPHRRLVSAKVKAFANFAVERIGAEMRAILDGLDLATLR